MCTVEKMLVKGIRSFSPDNNNVIEFYKPLTLIVGSNGAGKTTVIECLKQACTGELPPNVGGQGKNWVMDPKVAGESEVKAQIKLRLRTSTQMPFVVVRSFQSVQKKSLLQFKSLDATLQTYNKDTHQKEAITYRCADINTMVPTLMGVSKAVLDNVIFVHQEESNWPLADGATIKKKFDEIFAATKYTKALETLRKLRLEKTQEVKEMKLKMETLKSHKDSAQGLSRDVEQGNQKAEQLSAYINELQERIVAAEDAMREVDAKLDQMADAAEDITRLSAQQEVINRATSDKLARLDGGDFEEDDQTLEASLQEVIEADASRAATRESLLQQLKVKQMDLASYEERSQQAQQQLNKLQAAAETHASNIADRDAFITQTAAKMGIVLPHQPAAAAAYGGRQQQQLSGQSVELFLSEMRQRQAQQQAELTTLRGNHRQEEAALNGRIDQANAALAQAEQTSRGKSIDLRNLERRRENLNQQVVAMAGAQYQAEDLQLKESELASKLEAKRSEESRQDFTRQLEEQREALQRLAAAMSNLRTERDQVIMAGDAASRLRSAHSSLQASRAKLDALMQGHGVRQLLQLIGNPQPPPPAKELRRLAEAALQQREQQMRASAEELKRLEAEAAKLSGELTSKRRERVGAESRSQALRSELRRAVGQLSVQLEQQTLSLLNMPGKEHEAFVAALKQVETTRAKKCGSHEKAVALDKVLTMIVKDSQEACRCVLCNRAFDSEEQMEDMLNYIHDEQAELPQRAAQAEAEIAELDRQLAGLNNLRGSLLALNDMEALLPQMRAEEERMSNMSIEQGEQLESSREEVALLEVDLMALRKNVREAGWAISNAVAEVEELTRAAAAAQAAADASGTGALQPVEDLDAKISDLESEQRRVEGGREDIIRRQGRIKDERVRLSELLAGVREELRRASEANRAKLEAQSQLRDVDEQIVALQAAISTADAAIGPSRSTRDSLLAQRNAMREQQLAAEGQLEAMLRSTRDSLLAQRNAMREQQLAAEGQLEAMLRSTRDSLLAQRNAMREQQLAAEGQLEAQLRSLQSALDGLAAKQRVVDDYGAAAKTGDMNRLGAQLEELRVKKEQCSKDIAALQDQLDRESHDITLNQGLATSIKACLDYRRSLREKDQIEMQIAQLTATIGQVGNRDQLQATREQAMKVRTEAQRAQDEARGSLSVVIDHTKEAKRSLADPRYHQIHGRYRKQLIELKTTELAAGDLDKYHKALERALLAFHTGKMSDINKIVKELWQKTYRGQDIDYIQIKADAEATARSYNYRVVMVNSGVELDMRGRCSAGQKVLACLIIRLALAETFCLNCGILALDEPTTNLDAENSASLADALRSLMVTRREQDNFQLIVITHDEHFAHLIGTRQHAEYLWRITKDDNQRSHIAQEEILD